MLNERFIYFSLLLFSLALLGCGRSEPVGDAGEETQTPQSLTTAIVAVETEMPTPDLDFDSGKPAHSLADFTAASPTFRPSAESFTESDLLEGAESEPLTTKPQSVLKQTTPAVFKTVSSPSIFKLVSSPSVPATSATEDTKPTLPPPSSEISDSDLDFTDEEIELDLRPKVPARATTPDSTGEGVQQLTVVNNYPNNKLRLRWRIKKYKDGRIIFHGPYEEFYENGSKFSQGVYVDGKLHGEWNFWHKNGQLAKKSRYVNGKPEGTSLIYRADGTLAVLENYSGGKPEGRWTHYLSDGKQVVRQEEYLQGKRHGQWMTWFEPKDSSTEELQKESTTNWQSGRRHGEQFLWFENGQPAKEEYYFEDKPHGLFKVWRENGSLAGQQQYAHGVPGNKG